MKNALPFLCIGSISLSGQLAELQAVRLIRVLTEALLAIFLVFRIVPVKEHNRRIAFKRHNVRSDAIEEPAVVADDQYAAREIFQTVFKGTHGVYVNIVRRFVKQDDVGTGFEHPGGVYAVPFAAGQDVNLLLLIRAREVETGAIGAGVDFPVAELDCLGTVADQLIYGLARRQDSRC